MAIQLPDRCCWNCAHSHMSDGTDREEVLARERQLRHGTALLCRHPTQMHSHRRGCMGTARCAAAPVNCAYTCRTRRHRAPGTSCRYYVEGLSASWLKGEDHKKVPECEHCWCLIGMAMPHFVMWCPKCGSIMKSNKRKSEALTTWHTVWDDKCRHNPKHPRIMIESVVKAPKMREEEAEIRKLLAAAALKHGMITLSDKDIVKAGIAPDVKVSKTKRLGLTVIKLKMEGKDG